MPTSTTCGDVYKRQGLLFGLLLLLTVELLITRGLFGLCLQRSLEKLQAVGHVELFSGTAEAVLLRHTAPVSYTHLDVYKRQPLEW